MQKAITSVAIFIKVDVKLWYHGKASAIYRGLKLIRSFGKYRYPTFLCLRSSAEGSAEGLRLTFCLSQLRFNTAVNEVTVVCGSR